MARTAGTCANGNWNGDPNAATMAEYAVSSKVVSITIPVGEKAVGSVPSTVDPANGYVIKGYTAPTATAQANPYSPTDGCGSGYGVVDTHDLGGAIVHLLYSSATGRNCVVTLAATPGGTVPMSATLSVQGSPPGGTSASDSGSYTYYAGPVSAPAAAACVRWGGSYQGTSWTSDWSHCDRPRPSR